MTKIKFGIKIEFTNIFSWEENYDRPWKDETCWWKTCWWKRYTKDLIFETLQEDGNIDYQLLQSIEEDTLTFVEKWESPDALKKHMASPHFLNFGEESEEFIENMTIQVIAADELSL